MKRPNQQGKTDAYETVSDATSRLAKNGDRPVGIIRETVGDRRAQEIRDDRQPAWHTDRKTRRQFRGVLSKSEPATEKQLDFLDDLGVMAPDGLTRRAASRLIDICLEERQTE